MRYNRKSKKFNHTQRARRVRMRLVVTEQKPRATVFRSLKHIRGQIIALRGRVLCAASDQHIKDKQLRGVALAKATGRLLGDKAVAAGIQTVVFDRGRYAYHGRVKAFAEGLREAGLQF